jgi:hypothetical protein
MSLVIAQSLVLSDLASGGGIVTADNPVIGYDSLVDAANIAASTEDPAWPAVNLSNPSTYLRWRGLVAAPPADELITIAANSPELLDYLGIAGHNFHTQQIPVSVEILNGAAAWEEIVAPFIPPNDGPLLIRFAPQAITSIRVRLQPGLGAPTAAVIYLGKLLVLQRRIYVGHAPMPYARELTLANPRSISGAFLGRIVLSEKTGASLALRNITPGWYRSHMEPFLVAAKEVPFFFAWRPASYPYEVGYAWIVNDPKPVNQRSNGMMEVAIDLEGIVR